MRAAIAENLARIDARIRQACGRASRNRADVRLIAVTKGVGLEEVRILQSLGVTHFGENRTQPATEKITAIGHENAVWHMIGNIQRRKAKDVVNLFDMVDAVDRLEVAEELSRRMPEDRSPLPILLEVNVSGEASKHGFDPSEVARAIESVQRLDPLKLEGLMTMAPLVDNPEEARPVFAKLRELATLFGLPRISMGMTNDFEVAIEEGATEVRIGTALFEGVA